MYADYCCNMKHLLDRNGPDHTLHICRVGADFQMDELSLEASPDRVLFREDAYNSPGKVST